MKLLITCFGLGLSGSSTYTFTLARSLKKKGVYVDVITQFGGILSTELRKAGIPVYNRLSEITGKTYTCIIGQHNSVVKAVRRAKPDVPLVFISHGILPSLEQPPSYETNIQRYIAVSEEVKNHIVTNYSIPVDHIDVLWNFVDVERFKPLREINDSPMNVLFVSNVYTPEVRATITRACKQLGLSLNMVGKRNRVRNVENHMNNADIVISLGRGIIEAMACARAVIVYDYLGGDGMITRKNIEEIRKHNFSGRCFRKKYSVEDLMREIGRYDKTMGITNRHIILREHNVSLAVDRILGICSRAQESFSPMPVRPLPAIWGDPLRIGSIVNRALPTDGNVRRIIRHIRKSLMCAGRAIFKSTLGVQPLSGKSSECVDSEKTDQRIK